MHHTVAYDPSSRRVLVHGGAHRVTNENSPSLGDLWSWDGRRWNRLAENAGVITVGHRLFADGSGGIFVVDGSNGVTSRWDGQRLAAVTTDSSQRRGGAAGAWDSRRRRYVTFGGTRGGTRFGDTWEFDGARWTQVAASGPPAVNAPGMAFDEARGVTVLFGGSEASGRRSGETWEWNGSNWTRVATSGPAPRSAHGMVYDTRRKETIVFGGADPNGRLGDTWAWDGRTWRQLAVVGPPPRAEAFMAFDAARGVAVLFGGFGTASPPTLGDTWEWNGERWTRRD